MRVTPETILEFLTQLGVTVRIHEHHAMFCAQDAEDVVLNAAAADTKNLFLEDEGSGQLYLVVVPLQARVALKDLAKALGRKRFSFASAELLQSNLGVSPGSVTVLGVLNDGAGKVRVIIDQELWGAPVVLVHPLRNTATIELTHEDLSKVLRCSGHEPVVMAVPRVPVLP